MWLNIIKHQLIGIPVILLNTISPIIVALALLFYLKDKRTQGEDLSTQRLPKWLAWLDNADDKDLKLGLNGDLKYQSSWTRDSVLNIYLMRLNWIGLRNPLNNLKRKVLSVPIEDILNVHIKINRPVGKTIGDYNYPGIRYVEATTKSGRNVFELYIIYLLPSILWINGPKCVRIRIGYKIGYGLEVDKPNVQWVNVLQPYKKFAGSLDSNT